jgi:tetratricopeptide (TPR) repeat protein
VLEAASACLALDPARHECDYTAGLAQQALGKYPEAESNFRKAIAGNAENGRYHVTLASLLVEQRRFADARVALGAASRDVPMVQRWKEELFSLRMLSAEVARAESDAPAAIDALEQATAIAGDAHPEAAFELGKAYADLTPPNTEKATRLFRHFIKRACRGARRAELQAQCVEAERRLSATP